MNLFLRTALLATGLSLQQLAGMAQTVTVVGGNLISALSPINHAAPDGVYEGIYLQSQIMQAGQISRLAIDKTDGTLLTPLDGVSIYLKMTTATAFTAGPIDSTGYTRVFRGAFPNATAAGFQEITLSQPFAYNNTDNLSVLIIRRGGTNISSTVGPRARYRYGTVSGRNVSRRYTAAPVITPATQLAVSNILVNLRLEFSTPSAVRASAGATAAQLYPNPAPAEATLDAREWTGPLRYYITDALGRTVRPATALPASASGLHQLPLASLPAGSYHLHLSNGTQHRVLPLVRQ